jgi:tetratricopeptide (TPR) repeat protein
MSGQARYRAFISYSHQDRRIARQIQRKLETYRVPRRLVGNETRMGIVPRRLAPIFLDQDDLPAAQDLKTSVKDALAVSDALIVICSPAAAASRWVNREIVVFRELNPTGLILTAIVGGEPLVSVNGGDPRKECFPHALLETRASGDNLEPLAADFRAGGDDRRVALVKLVAGLLDLRLDQIIERDLQRRQRRVMVITVLSVLLSLVMGTMALFALSARAEAERRRSEAEGLIEFMLSDLQEKLEPVGRLDVLDAVGEKVIEYYADQTLEALTPDGMGRRARAFHLLGRIDSSEGELNSALAMFTEAYRTSSQLLEAQSENSSRIFEHSQSAFWVGYSAWQSGQLNEAEAYFVEYRDLAERLVLIDPTNLEWSEEAAHANKNLGVIYLQSGRLEAARTAFDATIQLFESLALMQEGDDAAWINVADTYAWRANVAERLEGRQAAIEMRMRQIAIYETQLVSTTENWEIRRDAMNAEYGLGRLHLFDSDRSDLAGVQSALEILQSATFETDALILHDPANVEWRLVGARQRLWLAQALLMAGDTEAASQAYLDATAYMAHPSWASDGGARFVETRMHAALIEAEIFAATGQLDSTETALDHLLASLIREPDWQTDFRYGPYLFAAAGNLMADTLTDLGDMAGALASWQRVVEVLAPYEDQLRIDASYEYQNALMKLQQHTVNAE